MFRRSVAVFTVFILYSALSFGRNQNAKIYSVRVFVKTAAERNIVANAGIAIDKVFSDSIAFIGTQEEINQINDNLKKYFERNRLNEDSFGVSLTALNFAIPELVRVYVSKIREEVYLKDKIKSLQTS